MRRMFHQAKHALQWLVFAVAFGVTVILIIAFFAAPSRADETKYSSDSYWDRPWQRHVERERHKHHRQHHARPRYTPPVKAWHHHIPKPDPVITEAVVHCLPAKRAIGTPHLTESEAINAAKRAWGSMVRYDHGEKYMNVEDAAFVRHRCARAETNETALGRAAETLTGGEAWRTRCEIVAQPCRRGLSEIVK